MNQLIEDYQRRIKTINQEIDGFKFKDDANQRYLRLKTKLSCYKTFVAELKRESSAKN